MQRGDRAGLAQGLCNVRTRLRMRMVCVQPGDKTLNAQSVYVQFRDRAGLSRGWLSSLWTRLYMHMVCVQHGDSVGLAQGVCAA